MTVSRRPEVLIAWASQVLRQAGVPELDSHEAARLLVRSDQRGYGTHGLARLSTYCDRLRDGTFNPRPDIRIERHASVWVVQADGAMGQVLGAHVLRAARKSLQSTPMLWLAIQRTGHLGALGVLALEAAEAGLLCLLGQRTPPLLGLLGFQRRAIGHNPFAFAAPAGAGQPPLVFDMACSVAARGHILLAARSNEPIPGDWALDAQGQPTTDAKAAATGMLLPTGGYKGMGLAMMVECLAAAFAAQAGAVQQKSMALPANGAVGNESAFMLLLNPNFAQVAETVASGQGDQQTELRDAPSDVLPGVHYDDTSPVAQPVSYAENMAHWIGHYMQSADDGLARVPGQRGDAMEAASLATGLAYPPAIEAELQALAQRTQIELP